MVLFLMAFLEQLIKQKIDEFLKLLSMKISFTIALEAEDEILLLNVKRVKLVEGVMTRIKRKF